MDPFIGEIKLVPYNFAPIGWLPCDGRPLSISEYDALFNLIGTTYGGDGLTTFNLPDLRGRAIMHQMQGAGLSPRIMGESAGSESHILSESEIPPHRHELRVASGPGTSSSPSNAYLAVAPDTLGLTYKGVGDADTMPRRVVVTAGSGEPHDNMQPYLTLKYIIATEGIYPSPA